MNLDIKLGPIDRSDFGYFTAVYDAGYTDVITIYVASKTRHAEMWRQLREEFKPSGIEIVSGWIDQAGPNESTDLETLWREIGNDVNRSDLLIMYVEPEDEGKLKGALVEAGWILGRGGRVVVVGGRAETLGSWINDWRVAHTQDHTELRSVFEQLAEQFSGK